MAPPINIGGVEIADFRVGGNKAKSVFVGDQKVWPSFDPSELNPSGWYEVRPENLRKRGGGTPAVNDVIDRFYDLSGNGRTLVKTDWVDYPGEVQLRQDAQGYYLQSYGTGTWPGAGLDWACNTFSASRNQHMATFWYGNYDSGNSDEYYNQTLFTLRTDDGISACTMDYKGQYNNQHGPNGRTGNSNPSGWVTKKFNMLSTPHCLWTNVNINKSPGSWFAYKEDGNPVSLAETSNGADSTGTGNWEMGFGTSAITKFKFRGALCVLGTALNDDDWANVNTYFKENV